MILLHLTLFFAGLFFHVLSTLILLVSGFVELGHEVIFLSLLLLSALLISLVSLVQFLAFLLFHTRQCFSAFCQFPALTHLRVHIFLRGREVLLPKFLQIQENIVVVFKVALFYRARELFFEPFSLVLLFHEYADELRYIAPNIAGIFPSLTQDVRLRDVGFLVKQRPRHGKTVGHVYILERLLALSLSVQKAAKLFTVVLL